MKFMLSKSLLAFALISSVSLNAQTGGNNSFQGLNSFYTARHLGLSGNLVNVRDNDINTLYSNPASLNEKMHAKGSLSESIRGGGVNFGSLAYGRQLGKTFGAAHFRYISYGAMDRTDFAGNNLGSFTPGDFILGASAARLINPRMSIGATFNILYSQIDSYYAIGNSLDIGGQYFNDDKNMVIAGAIKNIGAQWKGFTTNKAPLPLNVQLGISKKLEHAPFRIGLTAQHLQQWDLSYVDPTAKDEIDPLTGDTIKVKKASFFEKVARHALIQTELNFGKKMQIRVGFDVQRRLEMRVANRPGLAGFSFGTAVHLKRFSIEYGWMIYSVAGSQHGLTFSMPLGSKNTQ